MTGCLSCCLSPGSSFSPGLPIPDIHLLGFPTRTRSFRGPGHRHPCGSVGACAWNTTLYVSLGGQGKTVHGDAAAQMAPERSRDCVVALLDLQTCLPGEWPTFPPCSQGMVVPGLLGAILRVSEHAAQVGATGAPTPGGSLQPGSCCTQGEQHPLPAGGTATAKALWTMLRNYTDPTHTIGRPAQWDCLRRYEASRKPGVGEEGIPLRSPSAERKPR